MHAFSRPTTPTVSVQRQTMAGACPGCGGEHLAAYRVLSEGGWWNVIKCQDCLTSISRKPGPLLGTFTPLGTTIG